MTEPPAPRSRVVVITPADLGSAIVYLASKEARMVTGSVLAFDGGMS
jgi:meso-butanediol dehydrogenase/(S,S)-butanediol dehydrogenase/diacetyl reductase